MVLTETLNHVFECRKRRQDNVLPLRISASPKTLRDSTHEKEAALQEHFSLLWQQLLSSHLIQVKLGKKHMNRNCCFWYKEKKYIHKKAHKFKIEKKKLISCYSY